MMSNNQRETQPKVAPSNDLKKNKPPKVVAGAGNSSIVFESNTIIFPKSPLRYPGGKSRAISTIIPLIPKGTKQLLSPFLGGASIEIAASACGITVHGYDAFDDLVTFWQFLKKDPKALSDYIRKLHPNPHVPNNGLKESFYQYQKDIATSTGIHKAALFFILNRCSFSGSTLSGGFSPNHPRFTASSIDRLEAFRAPNLFVHKKDCFDALNDHPDLFAYLDPPYLIKNTLYGVRGDMHKGFDHERLAKVLAQRSNWIMSYNDSQELRDLYKGFYITTPTWSYGMSKDKTSKEVLIYSKDLSPKNNSLPKNTP